MKTTTSTTISWSFQSIYTVSLYFAQIFTFLLSNIDTYFLLFVFSESIFTYYCIYKIYLSLVHYYFSRKLDFLLLFYSLFFWLSLYLLQYSVRITVHFYLFSNLCIFLLACCYCCYFHNLFIISMFRRCFVGNNNRWPVWLYTTILLYCILL